MMVEEHVYPRNELGRDYMRAFIGLAICVGPFFWVTPAWFVIAILGTMAAIFLLLLWQTVIRQITRIVVDDQGITMIALRRRTISWDQLRLFQLSYFTTWKNITGFMELKLKGAGRAMRIGSGLLDFRSVAQLACDAAFRNRLDFNVATIENLRHLNIADPRIDPEDGAEAEGDTR